MIKLIKTSDRLHLFIPLLILKKSRVLPPTGCTESLLTMEYLVKILDHKNKRFHHFLSSLTISLYPW